MDTNVLIFSLDWHIAFLSTAIEVLIRQNYTVTEGGVVGIVVEVSSTDYEFDFTVTLNHMNGSAGGE